MQETLACRPSRVAPSPHRFKELFLSRRADTVSRVTSPLENDCLANLYKYMPVESPIWIKIAVVRTPLMLAVGTTQTRPLSKRRLCHHITHDPFAIPGHVLYSSALNQAATLLCKAGSLAALTRVGHLLDIAEGKECADERTCHSKEGKPHGNVDATRRLHQRQTSTCWPAEASWKGTGHDRKCRLTCMEEVTAKDKIVAETMDKAS